MNKTSQMDKEKQALYSRLHLIESDLSIASGSISRARSNISHVEGSVGTLTTRLSQVRGRGYEAMAHLEKGVEQLTKTWADVSPSIKQTFQNSVEPLTTQVNSLQAETRGLRSQIDTGNISYGHITANRLSATASSLRNRVTSEATKVDDPLSKLIPTINTIDGDLKIAENTTELLAQSSFPLKQEESSVLAFEGKIMKGEKSEGTLYLTNQRFIFEAKKEVVVEKKFFIATKKRTERTVQIDQPIGAVEEISKGRVGLIAWTGIYVRFKRESGQQEAQFDVEGWEADATERFFNYIISGDADKDIATIKGTSPITPETPGIQVVYCTHCHAPYTREIYKGQKSVQCDYCKAQIVVQ